MTNFTLDPQKLFAIKTWVTEQSPLIHCITNHISINDCANVVLAVGAKPIMAEHPAEVAEITATAKALAVNLGNITDTRMKSMLISGQTARSQQIPMIIDLVGVACSRLRLDFSKKFVAECRPQIIKGNISELRAFAGLVSGAKGIDVGKADLVTETTLASNIQLLKSLALETGSVVLATGAVDLITDGVTAFKIQNGCEMLALITGTGCMLNVLTAAFIASQNIIGGALLATAYMGICGELAAAAANGSGTFKTALLDSLFTLSSETFTTKLNCQAI